MANKVELIKQEIGRLRQKLPWGCCSSQISMECNCKNEAYDEILSFINSLPEESVNNDLEKMAEQYAFQNHGTLMAQNISIDAFKACAQWQKEQILKNSIIAHVFGKENGKSLFCFKVDDDKYLVGNEVKIILVKED